MLHSQNLQNSASKPLVSFIITTCNTDARQLRACVESVLKLSLSHNDRELIVIDDGSREPAINVLLDFCDELIYVRQPNQRLSMARNRGISMAQGKYLQFVDGDDYLLQSTYEHCLDLVRYHQPDLVLFQLSTSPKVPLADDYEGPCAGVEYMQTHNLRGTACGYLFSKHLLHGLRFTTMRHYAEDEEFTAQLILQSKHLFSTSAKAYFYRQHAASALHQKQPKNKLLRLQDTEDVILALLEKKKTLTLSEQKALERRILQLTMDYLYLTARLTHSYERLTDACERMRKYGLFPLPNKHYTKKYSLFRNLINYSWGRKVILATMLK